MTAAAMTAYPAAKDLLLKRVYPAPIHRVFKAWIDVNDLIRWFTPNPDWPARVRDLEVREGGGFVAEFGDPAEAPWVEQVQYLTIDPPGHLMMLGHMTRQGEHVCITRYDIRLTDLGSGTELALLETGAPPDALEDRAGGWGGTLDNLGRLLSAP
jgi:uncharacterized protein YndB with AHSA1/START domain